LRIIVRVGVDLEWHSGAPVAWRHLQVGFGPFGPNSAADPRVFVEQAGGINPHGGWVGVSQTGVRVPCNRGSSGGGGGVRTGWGAVAYLYTK